MMSHPKHIMGLLGWDRFLMGGIRWYKYTYIQRYYKGALECTTRWYGAAQLFLLTLNEKSFFAMRSWKVENV